MRPPTRSAYDDDDDDDFTSPPVKKSAVWLWLLLLGGGGLFGLFACCGCGIGLVLLFRDDLTNTTWSGTENLAGFGRLKFEFKGKGVAVMTDAHAVVKGTWVRNGSQVTIRFVDCEYRGTINGKAMNGTAQGSGPLAGQAWQFSVVRD